MQLDPADAPTLSGTMDKFASLPRNDWGRLVLDDAEIVGLVNVRVISTYLSVPPARVLAERVPLRRPLPVASYNRGMKVPPWPIHSTCPCRS